MEWAEPQTGQIGSSDPNALNDWFTAHPNSFWGLTVRAKSLMAEGKWEQAKEPLGKLISLYPQYTGEDNAYRLLAEVHRNLDETKQEREALGKLAGISSDAVYAFDRLMQIDTEQENWRQVLAAGEKYLAVYPLTAGVYLRMGRANQELGRDTEAVESYRRLLLLDPADPADINYRLAMLLRRSDPVRAKRHVLEALADAPRFRKAHRLLLKILGDARKTEEPTIEDERRPPIIQEDSQ
jgi:tetratricopeptide (TPR) repeat protein